VAQYLQQVSASACLGSSLGAPPRPPGGSASLTPRVHTQALLDAAQHEGMHPQLGLQHRLAEAQYVVFWSLLESGQSGVLHKVRWRCQRAATARMLLR
jgi:hypothetical protein